MLQQQRIRQSRCRIRPRRVGEALRLDVAEAPLHYPCQCCKQLRIRRRRIGDVLRVELANAAANGASDCALLRIEVAEAGSTILAMLERLQPRAPSLWARVHVRDLVWDNGIKENSQRPLNGQRMMYMLKI